MVNRYRINNRNIKIFLINKLAMDNLIKKNEERTQTENLQKNPK